MLLTEHSTSVAAQGGVKTSDIYSCYNLKGFGDKIKQKFSASMMINFTLNVLSVAQVSLLNLCIIGLRVLVFKHSIS